MNNNIINKIADFLAGYGNITFSYIFGSFVKSQKKASSLNKNVFNDIDIAVYITASGISDDNNYFSFEAGEDITQDSLSQELKMEIELEEILHIPVDVRVINAAPLAFQYNVIKNGIVIIDKDKNLRADFEGLVFKKYFEYAHLRNEYLKNIVNAPI
jgi:predicted nucleotidyltransferase